MTDDSSPENLRKFLESDDPALVRMGLSMAKGAGVPEELLPTILKLYMWDDDKTIRAAAKSTFMKIAPEDAKQAVKENWKASYRADVGKLENICKELSSLGLDDARPIERIIQIFQSRNPKSETMKGRWGYNKYGVSYTATVLGEIGDARAVEPLIKALGDEDEDVRDAVAEALGKIGDARAVEPLIGLLGDENSGVRRAAVLALGEISDARAVEPLITALGDEFFMVRQSAAYALGKIGDDRAVEPLIGALNDDEVRIGAAEALGVVGDARAVEPLIKVLGDEKSYVRECAVKALGDIGDARAVKPLIELLVGRGEYRATVSTIEALGKIGDARAIEPLIKALDKLKWKEHGTDEWDGLDWEDWNVREAVKEALRELGHEVK